MGRGRTAWSPPSVRSLGAVLPGRRHRRDEAGGRFGRARRRGAGAPGRTHRRVRSVAGVGGAGAVGAGRHDGDRGWPHRRRSGVRRADDQGRQPDLASQHPRMEGLPPDGSPGGAHRAARVRRQRREGAGAGRRMVWRGPGPGQLHGDGGQHRGGWRHRPRGAPAGRGLRQRRPRRARGGGARRSVLRLRWPRLPGGGGVGPVHRRGDGTAGGRSVAGRAGAHRAARGARRRRRVCAARPRPRGSGRFGGAGFRLGVLRRRAAGAGRALPDQLRPRRPDRARRARSGWPAGRRGGRGPARGGEGLALGARGPA